MNSDRVFLAYCNTGALANVTRTQARRLTHLNIAFGIVKDDLIDIEQVRANAFYIRRLRDYNPDLVISLSTGGGGRGGHGSATRPEHIEAFVRSTLDAVRELELDGIDCDWEFPCNTGDLAERAQHVELIRRYRAGLDAYAAERGRRAWLTIAAACWDRYLEHTDVAACAPHLDFINLMTYDIRDCAWAENWTGHHSNLRTPAEARYPDSVELTVQKFHALGIPLDKLVIGSAFYSRRWDNVPDVNHGYNQRVDSPCVYGPSYTAISLIYERDPEYVKYWDESAQAAWLFNGSSFITYDDPRSMRAKARYVKESGVRGIMYWCHDSDDTGILFNAIYDELFS